LCVGGYQSRVFATNKRETAKRRLAYFWNGGCTCMSTSWCESLSLSCFYSLNLLFTTLFLPFPVSLGLLLYCFITIVLYIFIMFIFHFCSSLSLFIFVHLCSSLFIFVHLCLC